MQSKIFVFTINNYNEVDLRAISKIKPEYAVVFGKEVGAEGTCHLQGCIWRIDESRFRRSTAERLLGGRAYLDKSQSYEGAVGYCLKDGDWWTNLCTADEVDRLKSLVKRAQEFGNEPTWLGSVFFNSLGYSEYEPSLPAHDMHMFNYSH